MTVGNAFAGETEVRMGGIAGTWIDTQLKNCIHSGSMETTATFALRSVPSVAYFMGGIAGEASYSVIDNCYYDSDNQDVPAVGSIDEETEVTDKVAGMPTRAFMDGTVAYLLGDGFGQQIGKDAYPVFGGDRIYASTDCEGNEIFSNSEEADHIDVDGDGICDTCDTDTTINANPYDVNLDGVINISDVNDLLVYLAGSAENDDYHWDVDGNGVVNIADLNELLVELTGGNE